MNTRTIVILNRIHVPLRIARSESEAVKRCLERCPFIFENERRVMPALVSVRRVTRSFAGFIGQRTVRTARIRSVR